MVSWMAPFAVLIVFMLLYFYVSLGKPGARDSMKRDLNFYLVCVLAVAILSITASIRYGRDWVDVAVWVIAVFSICAMLWRFKSASPVAPIESARGPLEQNDNDRGIRKL